MRHSEPNDEFRYSGVRETSLSTQATKENLCLCELCKNVKSCYSGLGFDDNRPFNVGCMQFAVVLKPSRIIKRVFEDMPGLM